MTAPAGPAPAPEPPVALDAGALWKRMEDVAQDSPRDMAMVGAFRPVGLDGAVLVVRPERGGGGGTAMQEMLASLAARAAGRPVRVRVDAERAAPPRAVPIAREAPAARPGAPDARATEPDSTLAGAAEQRPAARSPAPGAALRDDPAANHPLVREVSSIFDATVVRVEVAGTLPSPTEPAQDAEPDGDPSAQGGTDV